ncbi:hypothetical protein DFR24_2281 [Panacagrimonas perspica]|uniref:Uncharacterized protein n=1 Tax=Panacagrimonas perspica TaxID=381431 RepID=A0A4R7PGR9_9GAMM|nr:hypothetical protein [Panacagrimonas perspica]TDU32871.1 hypothetical protein DFR24_2281 [Panacagrimonas perspica]THD00981.1 hypothetical protein B1810_22275 [Panacagrimonas perspica]
MDQSKPISYAEFGHNFVRYVVTAERLRGEIETVLKAMIEGSVSKFPADLLVASYVFQLQDVDVLPITNKLPDVSFVMLIEGDLKLEVKLINLRLKFTLKVEIRLNIDVRTYAPLNLKLILHPVKDSQIRTEVDGHGLPSEVLEHLRIVGPIVREEIVREVNARIASPELVAATNIDVLQLAATAQLPGGAATTAEPLAQVSSDMKAGERDET